MPAAGSLDLEAGIDRLHAGPIGAFVAARKELASRRRGLGDREGARRVAALPRPSATAWAVNRLYWHHRPLFDAVRESGERVRRAHEGTPGAGPLAAALGERREALAAAVRAALGELAAGHGPGSAAERRIRGTLEAVAAGIAIEPREGRLCSDLEPPSFDAISGLEPALAPLVACPEPAAPGSLVAEGPGRRAEREALALLVADLAQRRRAAERAAEAERAAAVRAAAASAEIGEAERRLERARRRSEEVESEMQRVRGEAASARAAVARAEEAVDRARGALGGD
jgi:hypothetical protein